MADPKRVDAGSGIGGITDLLNLIGGKQTTTKNSADTGQLKNILGQLQGQDYSQLLASIFQQAAGQMPGLQSRYANAVGARSGSNSAVQTALNSLLQQTALRGQQQIVQQQQANSQLQGDIAGKIAQLNSKQVSNSGTNFQRAAQGLAGLQILGKAMDSDLFKKGKDLFGGLFSSDTPATDVSSAAGDAPFSFGFDSLVEPSGSGNVFSSFAGTDVFGDAAANGGDWFDFGADFGSDASGDVLDAGGDASDWSSLFGFANGGLVGRDGEKEQKYADGGQVVSRAGGARRSAAPSFTPDKIIQAIAQQNRTVLNPLPQKATQKEVQTTQENSGVNAGDTETESGNGFTFGVGPLGAAKAAMDAAVAKSAQKSMLGMMSPVSIPGVTSSPLSFAINAIRAGLTQQDAMDAINKANDPIGALAVAQGWVSPEAATAMNSDSIAAAANAISAISNNSIDALDAAMGLTNAFGTGPVSTSSDTGFDSQGLGGNGAGLGGLGGIGFGFGTGTGGWGVGSSAGAAAGAGFGNGGYGSDGGSGGSDGGGGSGGGGDGGMKNGGRVPGKTDLSGSDTVKAKLTRGEYVISADVVEKLGVDFFDNLQAMMHDHMGK